MIDLAKRLIYLREIRDLSQVTVAKMLNMSPTGYFSYESGRTIPPAETLIKLADFYNISVDYLLGHKQENVELFKLNQDIVNLPPERQQKVIDYVHLMKLDASYQAQKNNKKKRVLPLGGAGSHQTRQAPPRSDAPGVAAHGGGVLDIDAEIEEDLKNFGKSINNEE